MNRFLLLISFLSGSLAVNAQTISEGTTELGISGFVDFASADDTTVQADLSWGRFVRDYWELGARSGVASSDSITRFRAGVFTEYHFELDRTFLPFVGVSLNILAADVDLPGPGGARGSESAISTGIELGAKGFLSPSVALSGGLVLELASQEIFLDRNNVDDHDLRLQIGLRYFF
jgi:hypothetical protein